MSLLPMMVNVALAGDYFSVNGIFYETTSKVNMTVAVTYQGAHFYDYSEYSGNVVIPEKVTYGEQTYSVTSIGDNAFNQCYGLKSVTIPNSVVSIGQSAFSGCI